MERNNKKIKAQTSKRMETGRNINIKYMKKGREKEKKKELKKSAIACIHAQQSITRTEWNNAKCIPTKMQMQFNQQQFNAILLSRYLLPMS